MLKECGNCKHRLEQFAHSIYGCDDCCLENECCKNFEKKELSKVYEIFVIRKRISSDDELLEYSHDVYGEKKKAIEVYEKKRRNWKGRAYETIDYNDTSVICRLPNNQFVRIELKELSVK